jgi:hypothetical protein
MGISKTTMIDVGEATRPTLAETGHQMNLVGIAISANVIYFNPSLDVGEHV